MTDIIDGRTMREGEQRYPTENYCKGCVSEEATAGSHHSHYSPAAICEEYKRMPRLPGNA